MVLNIIKIKNLVIDKGLSYTELAEKSGLSKTHISRLINSKGMHVRTKTIKKLANGLGVPFQELFSEEE